MRNLVEYPITVAEIVECLTAMSNEAAAENARTGVCGNLRPLILLEAAAIVEAAEKRRTLEKALTGLQQASDYLEKKNEA